MAFTRPHSNEALSTADEIRCRITGAYDEKYGPDGYYFEDLLGLDRDLFEIAYKPGKWTLLHRFTLSHLWDQWNYHRKKSGEEFIEDAHRLLFHYRTPFNIRGYPDLSAHKDYLFEQLLQPLKQIAHEVFCILFSDKELMRTFSIKVSEAIANACPSEYPDYLEAIGIMKRSSFWPTWLREALFYRENGRCAKCSSSLTGVFDPTLKPQVDHIVPISNGGTTDPTNLQYLCEPCNKKKGNRSNEAGGFIYVPWEYSHSKLSRIRID